MRQTVVFGMPYFVQSMEENFRAPYGNEEKFKKIYEKPKTSKDVTGYLLSEYLSILEKIKEMGYPIKILCGDYYPELKDIISKMQIDILEIHKDFPQPVYPRDAWVNIYGTNKIIIPNCMPNGKIPFAPKGEYIVNRFGEGGKVFSVGEYFITTEITDGDDPLKFTGFVKSKDFLPNLDGKKIVFVPNPTVVEQIKNGPRGYMPEVHIDRFMSVVKDAKGDVHVILDPCLFCGWYHPLQKPLHDENKSRTLIVDSLKKAGLKNIHIPKKIFNPYGIGVNQFFDGRLLMTSGETFLQEIFEKILGRENVFTTVKPISYYGALFRAGIHCLINEIYI